jgi:hypothetical protein
VRDPFSKFEWLANFDRDLMAHLAAGDLPAAPQAQPIWLDEQKNLMIYTRCDRIYAVNWHPTQSQQHLFIYRGDDERDCRVIFSSDDRDYGGQGRIDGDMVYTPTETPHGIGFFVYLPARCALVLEPIPKDSKKPKRKPRTSAKAKSKTQTKEPRKDTKQA